MEPRPFPDIRRLAEKKGRKTTRRETGTTTAFDPILILIHPFRLLVPRLGSTDPVGVWKTLFRLTRRRRRNRRGRCRRRRRRRRRRRHRRRRFPPPFPGPVAALPLSLGPPPQARQPKRN